MQAPRFDPVFPELFRAWIGHAPRTWPGPPGRWLDLARGRLAGAALQAPDDSFPRAAPTAAELDSELDDIVYLPPVPAVRSWWRQELRASLAERGVPPLVQFLVGEEVPAGAGIAVLDLTPALLPFDAGRLAAAEPGLAAVWPLVPGLTGREEVLRRGLEALARAEVVAVLPVAPELTAAERRELAELSDRAGYQEVFHREPPLLADFGRIAAEFGLASLPDRPALPGGRRRDRNRELAGALHRVGALLFATGGSEDEALGFFRAARWVDGESTDVAELVAAGNLNVVPWLSVECRQELEARVAGETTELAVELEAAYRGGALE